MIGILLDSVTGDILVGHGGMVIGDTDEQIVETVLASNRGEWKEWPLLGGEARRMLGGSGDVFWPIEVKRMLRFCGIMVNKITTDGDTISIE